MFLFIKDNETMEIIASGRLKIGLIIPNKLIFNLT
jgi:hypothetical protein